VTPPERVILVGCVKQKQRTGIHAAQDLYTSPLFRKRRAYAEAAGLPWLVLSAEHAVVEPSAPLGYYDRTLNTMGVAERRAWGSRVLRQLTERYGTLRGMTFEIHAGARYVAPIEASLLAAGARVEIPMKGRGLGLQLQWYGKR
jgi:hypothetical protein